MTEEAEKSIPRSALGEEIRVGVLYKLQGRRSVVKITDLGEDSHPAKERAVRGKILNFPLQLQTVFPTLSGLPNSVKILPSLIGREICPEEKLAIYEVGLQISLQLMEDFNHKLGDFIGFPKIKTQEPDDPAEKLKKIFQD
jgi:hypothetical protein